MKRGYKALSEVDIVINLACSGYKSYNCAGLDLTLSSIHSNIRLEVGTRLLQLQRHLNNARSKSTNA